MVDANESEGRERKHSNQSNFYKREVWIFIFEVKIPDELDNYGAFYF